MKALIAPIVMLLTLPAFGATSHAAPDGKGSECTKEQPCALDQAIRKASCGDTVSAADGTYGGIKISMKNCKAEKRLTVASASPQGAVLDVSKGEGIALQGTNYVTISGFRVNQRAGAGFGIQINGGTGVTMKDITVVGDTTTNCKNPPVIGDHVYAFETKDLTLDGLNVGKPEKGECNYVEDTVCFALPRNKGLTLKNSTCHDVRNFGNLSNCTDVMVDGNTIVNLHNHGIGMVDVTNAVVQRNIFYTTATSTNIADALWLVCSHGVNFRNNLVHGSRVFPVQGLISHPNCANSANTDKIENDWPNNDGIVHSNNMYIDIQKPGMGWAVSLWHQYWAPGTPLKSNHNLYNGNNFVGRFEPTDYKTLEAWTAAKVLGYPQDAKSLTARPLFVNEAGRDYRPASSKAPQVDAGDDANCANTIVGAHCDIGPFELAAAPAPPAAK